MEQLVLEVDGEQLRGSGVDVIGSFDLTGTSDEAGVLIIKQYRGQHHVEYYGQYDGEGTWRGRWGWQGATGGEWLIQIVRGNATGEILDISEHLPGRGS